MKTIEQLKNSQAYWGMSVIDDVINIQWHVLLNEEKDTTCY